ncbi:CoA-binding protein [uncultured Clostridium sp.]|jgi:predicted CoA-binding protein|uniref:CoA-binding protein n=1 Tax=uncultured Clostridium sp. TaxID=59620 RepID=UPI00263847F0|nr:CoA-binding protein [uncultured Clostridium sp.]
MDANYLISNLKNWVVIGDVLNESKYASKILRKFKEHSYTVSGVHPRGGDNIYTNLSQVPYKIEAIDLCINSIKGLEYLKEAKILDIKYVLIQPGASSDEIIEYCKENNITVVLECALISLG